MKAVKNGNTIKCLVSGLFLLLCHFCSAQDSHLSLSDSLPSYFELRQVTILSDLPDQNSYCKSNGFYQKNASSHLGSFCKLENKASAKAGMAVRMRLGTLDYVNRLENKLPFYRLEVLESVTR